MSLKRNLIANFLGQGWVALMGLAFVPLYIKYLGIEAYGLIGIFVLLQAWLSLLDAGMTPALGREMARFTGGAHSAESIRDLLRTIEILALGVMMTIVCIFGLSSDWVANSWLQADGLSVETVSQSLMIMGGVTGLRFVEGVYRSAIIGLQRQVLFNALNSSLATLRGLGAVGVLAWASPTLHAFFVWQGVVSLITILVLAAATYGNLPEGTRSAHFSLKALRRVWRFAGGMLGITFLALLLMQVDKLLLSRLLELSEYGYYTLATVAAGGLYMLINPITQAFYPKYCELISQNNAAEIARNFHQGAQLVSVVAGSAAIVLVVFSGPLLHLWTQNHELAERTAPILSLLALGNLLNGLMWVPYQMQLAHGWTSLAIRINIVAVACIVPAVLMVTPRFGAEGAAWVWVCLNTGYVLVGVHFMFARILSAEKWRWYLQDLMAPLAPAVLAALFVDSIWANPDGNFEHFLLLLAASACVFLTALMSARDIRSKLVRLLQPLIHRHA